MRMKKLLLSAFALLSFGLESNAQFTFTNAGATGRLGPTQAQINTAYTATSLAGQVTSSNGIQIWTVPSGGLYRIEAYGAQGGGANGGLGAVMTGEFQLNQNDVLHILVGQQGLTQAGEPNSVGGGGGTFVVKAPATAVGNILVIAGGGGGSPATHSPLRDAVTGPNGNGGVGTSQSAPGGTGGNGGSATQRSGGGGGFLTNGQSSTQTAASAEGGYSFLVGGAGGNHSSTGIAGSFGGGGAAWQTGFRGAGGGGGYSGGGGAQVTSNTNSISGGGGGSINNGLNQVNTAGIHTGHGMVIITPLGGIAPDDAGIANILQPNDTVFCKTPTNIVVELENTGTDSLFSATIHWSVDGVMQDSFLYTGALDTNNGAGATSANVTIGSFAFTQTGSYELKVWSAMPNGMPDTVNFNDTAEATIEVKLLDITILNQTNVSCHGGSNGGVLVNTYSSTATYDWGGGITSPLRNNLSAGSYFVTVTDIHNCPDTFEVTITQPDPLNHQIVSGGFAICNGQNGSVVFEGVGGTPPYNYLIMGAIPTNALNNIVPGTYAIQITDANNCVHNDSVSVINPPVLEGEIASITPAGCGGNAGAATASGSGGIAPYSYMWSDGQNSATASGLTPGDYEVTITDSLGCERIEIARVRSLDVSVTRFDPILGANNTTATSYQWINCETGEIIANETGRFFQPTQLGNYAVIVSDGTCSDTSDCFNVVNTFVALANKAELQSQIFPNPNQGQFTVRLNGNSENNVILSVYDIQGKEITRKNLGLVQGETLHTLELNIPHGVYLVRLQSEQWTEVKRMIVK
jgi:hypothetical protein